MSSLEVTFIRYLFTLIIIAISSFLIMPRAPREARIQPSARERCNCHTSPTNDEENLGTSRFRNPSWSQVRRHPLTPYPLIDDLNCQVRNTQDNYNCQTGTEFADLWLTDQLTAQYMIMRPHRRCVNVPTWLHHILDRAGEVNVNAVNATEVSEKSNVF